MDARLNPGGRNTNASTREAFWDPGWQAMARWRGSMLAGVRWLARRV